MWLLFGGLLSFHKGLRQKCSRVNVSCNSLVQRGRAELFVFLHPCCCCCCSCHMFVLVPTSSPHESPTLNEHWISCSWKIRFLSKSTFKKRKLNQRWSQVMHWSPDFWLLAEVKAAKTQWHLIIVDFNLHLLKVEFERKLIFESPEETRSSSSSSCICSWCSEVLISGH